MARPVDMTKIVSLAKRRGFVFPSSEIYGGMGATWDYGPLGVELKRNIKEEWWRTMVYDRDDIVGLDSAIIQSPRVWEASGHAEGFADPFYSCPACERHHRADRIWDLIWESNWWQSLLKAMESEKTSVDLMRWAKTNGKKLAPHLALVQHPGLTLSRIADLHTPFEGINADFKNFVGMIAAEADGRATVPCPACGASLGTPESAALMLETFLGPVRATAQKIWLRPETAQGIFINFDNVLTAMRMKLPFGIAQVGKSFRNEITPGNFIFRTREFEQMEMEFFVKPGDDDRWHAHWIAARKQWYEALGIRPEHLRLREHEQDELAHYAKGTSDIEYEFPWGWAELEGIANRTDFDLRRHSEFSGKELTYFDQELNEHYYPYIIEPAAGVDRAALAFIVDAYEEEPAGDETRAVLKFHPDVAPIKVAVLPLSRNEKLVPTAREVHTTVRQHFPSQYDDAQSIGRRYRRQDEIGTPLCVTVDFQTVEEDQAVTIRNRDTMEQVRVPIPELADHLRGQLRAMGSTRA